MTVESSYEELEKRVKELERQVSGYKRQDELQRLATVLKDSNDAITVQDFKGNILAWNHGAEKMYGYSEAEALRMNIREIIPENRREEALAFIERLNKGEQVESFETQRFTKDGRILDVWLTVTALLDKTGKPAAVATTERDITKRKRIEEELRQANKELKNFIHMVSHDLKTPLIAIQGLCFRLLNSPQEKLVDKGREYLERIMNSARRMEVLVSDLLTFSRVGEVKFNFKDVPSLEIVKEVALNLQDRIKGKGIELVLEPDLPWIYGDRVRIYQVFENLLVNAVKYIGNTRHPKIEVGCEDKGDFYQFYVRDNGIGIDPQYHQKIFEMFQRVREIKNEEGTGLGLAIVEKIVNGHGGKIWVESGRGKGATFYFTLPKDSRIRKDARSSNKST